MDKRNQLIDFNCLVYSDFGLSICLSYNNFTVCRYQLS